MFGRWVSELGLARMELVSGEEIQCRVRQVMVGEKGKEIKKNAEEWRELAIEAVSQGGSSDVNIDNINDILREREVSNSQFPEDYWAIVLVRLVYRVFVDKKCLTCLRRKP
ncbi:hypothetical protein Tsubulata_018311 [Turnera subulata]|uniref:Uncharacterized protein n=1 Tax=Turnera subulata TaxID=218843 RepID=A0A9Q0JPB9_9ROSI|nr:hypothetical protein Tsubulata_018311 [Turnera subulata]